MNNFKIKDLMISLRPQSDPDKIYIGAHFNMHTMAFEAQCNTGNSCQGATKPNCNTGNSCQGATKPNCNTGNSCQGSTKPAHLFQGEGSIYSSELLNLKQTLAGMQAKA